MKEKIILEWDDAGFTINHCVTYTTSDDRGEMIGEVHNQTEFSTDYCGMVSDDQMFTLTDVFKHLGYEVECHNTNEEE